MGDPTRDGNRPAPTPSRRDLGVSVYADILGVPPEDTPRALGALVGAPEAADGGLADRANLGWALLPRGGGGPRRPSGVGRGGHLNHATPGRRVERDDHVVSATPPAVPDGRSPPVLSIRSRQGRPGRRCPGGVRHAKGEAP